MKKGGGLCLRFLLFGMGVVLDTGILLCSNLVEYNAYPNNGVLGDMYGRR